MTPESQPWHDPTQAKADRLLHPKCSEMPPQLQKKSCSSFDPRPASVKPLRPYGENEKRALSLTGNINTKTENFSSTTLTSWNPTMIKQKAAIPMNLLRPLPGNRMFYNGRRGDRKARADSDEVIFRG